MKHILLFEKWSIGKLAKGKSIKDIAKLHNVSVEHINKQIAMGKKVELEHTDNKEIATIIAKDHLVEDPNYYTKLKKVEGE